MRYPLFPRYDKFNGPADPEVRRNKTRGISRGTRAYGFFFMVFKPFVSRRQLTMKIKKKNRKHNKSSESNHHAREDRNVINNSRM